MLRKGDLSKEEFLNAISHGVGVILSIIGLFFLIWCNSTKTQFALFSVLLYEITLLSMFLVSTGYHIVSNPSLKNKFRIIDHINIYYLIAGTYTPVALITLEAGSGWTIFYCVWAIAAIGTILKLFFTGKYELVSLLLYLAMGWLIILDLEYLLESITDLGAILLFMGGGFYTFGILFYAIERIPYNHFVWHLFVLAGAISHWFFIFLDVV